MVSSSTESPPVTRWPYMEHEEDDERLLRHDEDAPPLPTPLPPPDGARFSLGTGGSGVLKRDVTHWLPANRDTGHREATHWSSTETEVTK